MSTVASELTSLLVADTVTINGLSGYPATPTQVGGVNVAAAIECQSTTRGLLLPRMTTAQRDAMTPVVNGMMIYNTTTNSNNTYENGAWGAFGGGDVDGPGASTDTAIAAFNGVTGKIIQNTAVLLNPITGVISAIGGLINAAGTAGAPSLSFTGDTDTGIYRAGANQIGFATGGALQAVITGGSTTVNTLEFVGAVTGQSPSIIATGSDVNIGLTLETNNAGSINFITGVKQSVLSANAVLSIGTATLDATMTNGLQLAAGTAPTGQANTLQIFGSTIGGNAGTLGLRIPAGSLTASVDNVVTNKVQVTVNGTTYYLLATTSAA